MPAYKVVTNYNNMFSDHPGYPSHSYVAVPNGLKAQTRPLTSGTREQITSSSGLQVTGKDRALFFKRPVLQLSQVMPLPHIRYTCEIFFVKLHSLIRGVLIQSCSAGTKNFTNYVFCHPLNCG